MANPLVAILMGSANDEPLLEPTKKVLDELGVPYVVRAMSAHRTPDRVREFAKRAESDGLEVLICAAGGAAHLPGAVAANCTLPVIGIPLASSEVAGGLDAIYGVLQMPPGVPVAGVAVGSWGARNAAYLAASILALKHPDIREAYKAFRDKQSQG
ncbi:MAG: 5-(carboxyamino)imidazole ribonucleotide mutase [Dehalococcoidia bacterium]|uniref:5-(carboxyamino)imidazole ribonucleotide mutase n=1 Tax=Candidatus Amarobacter glycogenicus TaxID=3140699 RepID=UPI001D1DED94|nr:5-(carboxyamino)imidazole ribonucleotide mutase [Dehalococcoidia bacterium]MBK6560101.1 5-(carboxyamino)imidazole ribonucleotide mutase [Dehalococcoidia bacterium]MBK7125701.1 5-(carboxyamino)imidazole ribonucleotide mutase [Dehalococcoidia bacterium]MBK7328586.1 5-(carboxyamino)imidazole ribonucleotide mutase [Dehalococcoidia bacterium]MBK7724291.1 5-(carboxyamino)imidazole ribonucleotide mutase [Dehalococcoidia bacterium]